MAIVHIGQDEFEKTVLQAPGDVLVDYWATWCGPCKMIAPELEQLAAERPELTIAKIDIDQYPQLAISYGVSSIPTLLLFRNGAVAARTVGYQPMDALVQALGG